MGGNKKIIQLVVIIAGFVGAIYVLYSGGLFGGQPGSQSSTTAAPTSQTATQILPYGDILSNKKDFDKVIIPKRFNYDQIRYPVLDPKSDVGINEFNLIIPQTGQ